MTTQSRRAIPPMKRDRGPASYGFRLSRLQPIQFGIFGHPIRALKP